MSSFSNEFVSESDPSLSSVMSQSVRFLLVALLLNALRCNSGTHQTQHFLTNPDSSNSTAWPVTFCCCDREWTSVLS